MKDLKTYKDVMNFAEANSKIFLQYYLPGKVNEFFSLFTTTDSIPKQKKYKDFKFKYDPYKTLEEISQHLGLTRERIRQIEAKALRKLRHPSRSKKLRDYMN